MKHMLLQVELQRRLDAEFPRTHLDMRHRLDKDGNRYGKVINYKWVPEIFADSWLPKQTSCPATSMCV